MKVTRKQVIAKINALLEGKATFEEVEEWTGNVIGADDVDWADDATQEAVYVLDMWEVNELTKKDLMEEKKKLQGTN